MSATEEITRSLSGLSVLARHVGSEGHRHGSRQMSMETKLTNQMLGALQWIAARGEMRVGRENCFIRDELSVRTAWALERRGLVERRWSGARDGYVYITDEGQALADELLGEEDE